MRSTTRMLIVTAILIRWAAPAHANPPDPISGTWDVTFSVQGKTVPATFTFSLDEEKLTGSALSDHTGPGTIRAGGSFRDNALAFTLDFRAHESIDVTGTLEDGKLVGEFRTEGRVGRWDAKKREAEEPRAHAHP